MTAKAAEDN